VGTDQETLTTDPDQVRREVDPQESAQLFHRCVAGRLPLRSSVVKSLSCMYTVVPGHGFLVDRHPDHPNLLLALACSAHGFKHSPAVGESIAQWMVDGESAIDLSEFSLARFGI
jgi:sarcosine oxidase